MQCAEQLGKAFFEAANEKDMSALTVLISDDFTFQVNTWICKRDAFESSWQDWWRMLPDVTTDIKKSYRVDDNTAMIELCASGTQLCGPDGTVVGDYEIRVLAICTSVDGILESIHEYCDDSELRALQQA
jgi:ketosteroid isomerase-like protein